MTDNAPAGKTAATAQEEAGGKQAADADIDPLTLFMEAGTDPLSMLAGSAPGGVSAVGLAQ